MYNFYIPKSSTFQNALELNDFKVSCSYLKDIKVDLTEEDSYSRLEFNRLNSFIDCFLQTTSTKSKFNINNPLFIYDIHPTNKIFALFDVPFVKCKEYKAYHRKMARKRRNWHRRAKVLGTNIAKAHGLVGGKVTTMLSLTSGFWEICYKTEDDCIVLRSFVPYNH